MIESPIQPFANTKIRIPPQDLTAEQALLGSIMLKPKGLAEITDVVKPFHFYAEKHRLIYQVMLDLDSKGEPIDVISVTSALRDKKQLEQAGGAGYLAELVSTVPTASNLNYYAELVSKKAALRTLIDSASQILDLGYREDEEIDSIYDRAEKTLASIANFSKRTFVHIKDTLQEAWERFELLHKSDHELRGVPSGFKDLDNLLAGFQKSDLIILAARPSVGKTSLALDFVRHVAADHGIPVAIFSLEMSAAQLVDRLIASTSHVDSWKLRTGKINTDEEFSRIRDALDSLSKAPIFIDDEPGNTINKIRSVARRLKAEGNLGLIVVDYLQLMIPRRDSDSLVQQVTEISRSLKGLARELEVPVIALSQLNRAVEQRGGEPRLSDLRDSGSIEQDADVVMFIHREDRNDETSERKNIAKIIVAKHRNGPVGHIDLYFDEKRVSFSTIAKDSFGSFS